MAYSDGDIIAAIIWLVFILGVLCGRAGSGRGRRG